MAVGRRWQAARPNRAGLRRSPQTPRQRRVDRARIGPYASSYALPAMARHCVSHTICYMKATTIRVDISTRDRLARIADDEFHGASLGETLQRLIDEHEMQAAHAAYARLRSDPAAWDEYRTEITDWDAVTGDGLGSAADEYPEYNQ